MRRSKVTDKIYYLAVVCQFCILCSCMIHDVHMYAVSFAAMTLKMLARIYFVCYLLCNYEEIVKYIPTYKLTVFNYNEFIDQSFN